MAVEAVLAVLWLPIAISGVLTAGAWTYRDARARGMGTVSPIWGIAVAGFILLAPVYLVLRSRLGERDDPVSPTDRTLGVWSIGAVLSVVLAAVVAPPDPVTTGWYLLGLFPVGIIIGYAVVYREALFG